MSRSPEQTAAPSRVPEAGSRRACAGGDGAGSAVHAFRLILITAAITAIAAGRADAEQGAAPRPDLGQLIERFNATAPRHEGSVQLDAWVETGPERDEVVVVLEPQGAFKLVADPGITITPTEQPGVEWLVPLPHRHVDPEISYFTPPAAVRLPFRADGGQPLEILVEYAYCVVDYQCFFGEELLTVAARYD
jgi:hypothetical protein